ncbi:MAG: hypothetical protein ACEY3M_17945, partial [Wolbachia sp.]
MGTNDTQQEHIYNERIQEFFPLFDKIKKEDDLIYNARVDFNTVKFLTERTDWDWNEDKDKNKACGVILQECDKTNKARQELEDKAKEELNKYITIANNINDDVKDKKVSIYGNHASITLEDNKKEFKISEFLNSDFCQKNGISGFSTLHSDGKSGMHGFVAEEGEGKEKRKVRHYVVTDGSYEMTLNWYVNGEKCTIKVNIDKEGVKLIEGNGVIEDQLKANKDVKIGGLFLHQIQFREKGKGQENEMQKESSEIAIKSNSRDIEQEVKKPVQTHQATYMNREIGSQTPPLPPLRTSSLPPEKDVFNEQGRNTSAKPVSQDGGQRDKQNNPTPNNQQKGEHQPTTVSSGNDYGFPSSDPSDFTKSVSHNQDNRQKDERYDNPTFATFGHAVPGSQKPDRSEQTPNNQQKGATTVSRSDSGNDLGYGSQGKNPQNKKTPPQVPTRTNSLKKGVFDEQGSGSQKPDRSEQTPNNQQQPKTQQQEGNSKSDLLQDIRNFKKNNLRYVDVDDREASIAGSRKNNPSPLETLKDRIPYSPSPDIYNSGNQDASDAEWKESEQPLSATALNNKSESGYSSQIHAQPQVDPEQPKRSLENIEQSDQTPPENLLKEIRDRSQQDNRGLRQVDPTDKLSQDKEDGLQKDDLADVKI